MPALTEGAKLRLLALLDLCLGIGAGVAFWGVVQVLCKAPDAPPLWACALVGIATFFYSRWLGAEPGESYEYD